MGKKRKKPRKKSLLGKFVKIVFSMVIVFVIFAGASIFAYTKIVKNSIGEETDIESVQGGKVSLLDSLTGKKHINLNVAVMGTDKEGMRTDVLFVVHFDSKTGKLGVLSVPRDTRVKITNEMYDYLRENNKYIPTGRVCKINEVHSYSYNKNDLKKRNELSVLQLEELLGISIDNYVKVSIEGFRNIVDAIGGVEVDVPENMDYDDPVQDLHIHVKRGVQLLDGEHAEMLVRYRSYAQGDVARVQVQQLFLKEFGKKVTSTDTIIKNLPSLINTLYKDIDTDFTLSDCLKYANYISDVDMGKVEMETLPGNGEYVGNVSYFLADEEEIPNAVRRIFYSDDLPDNSGNISSKGKKIEIANGSNINGFAAENKEVLEKNGYTVSEISTYKGEQKPNTRIIVYKEGLGNDIKEKFYPDADIIVDTDGTLKSGMDILIILGTGEETE